MGDVNNAKANGIFRIIVHNVNNVPSKERFLGSPDPYIQLLYNGSFMI